MKNKGYICLNQYMLSHQKLSKAAVFLCKIITAAVYVFYPVFLVFLFFYANNQLLKSVLVPLISVIIISVIRIVLNRPRPYEIMDITPLYTKKTKGQSLPSRHTFAIFIIAFTVYFHNPLTGGILIFLGLLLAALRVIVGVHRILDVFIGFLFAVISSLIGFILI